MDPLGLHQSVQGVWGSLPDPRLVHGRGEVTAKSLCIGFRVKV